jgi:hypothetical protein
VSQEKNEFEAHEIGRSHPVARWGGYTLMFLVLYILSSGPVLGAAFWLREATHNDIFYVAIWIYFPVLYVGQHTPFVHYIEWWVVDVFRTVGPG